MSCSKYKELWVFEVFGRQLRVLHVVIGNFRWFYSHHLVAAAVAFVVVIFISAVAATAATADPIVRVQPSQLGQLFLEIHPVSKEPYKQLFFGGLAKL